MTEEEFKTKVMPCRQLMLENASRLLRDRDDILDCLQEALASLWKNRSSLSDEYNIPAYCITTVRHAAISVMRRRARFSDEDIGSLNLKDESDTLENKEKLRIVAEGLKTLPEKQRKVIMMNSLSDMTGEEIAKATGMSQTNIRTILSRGRKTLKEYFKKNYE